MFLLNSNGIKWSSNRDFCLSEKETPVTSSLLTCLILCSHWPRNQMDLLTLVVPKRLFYPSLSKVYPNELF